MTKKAEEKNNLTDSLKKLNEIVGWFENQQDVDVEIGLEKVKEAAVLIKTSKARLAQIENEFKEIEKEMNIEESSGSDSVIFIENMPY